MNKIMDQTKSSSSTDSLVKLYLFLAILGLGVAAYISYTRITGAPIVCALSSCEAVNNSPYAYILGIPISFYGLTFYALAINAALYKSVKWMLRIAIIGVLFTGYFTFIEAFVLYAWCQWCILSAWVSLCLLIVSLRLATVSAKQKKINQSKAFL